MQAVDPPRIFSLLQTASELPADAIPGGYGAMLLQSVIALIAVCVLAWVVLRWGAKKGLGLGGKGRFVEVLERVPLDSRRALVVVKAGERTLLLGVGEGPTTLLTELDEAEVAKVPKQVSAFDRVLERVRGKAAPDSANEALSEGANETDLEEDGTTGTAA